MGSEVLDRQQIPRSHQGFGPGTTLGVATSYIPIAYFQPFTHSNVLSLLSTYYMPRTGLGAEDAVMDR